MDVPSSSMPLVGVSPVHATFRPFQANNTRAYSFPVGSKIAPRDAIMMDATCHKQVVAAAKTAEARGFSWNAIGCSFPPDWRYDSSESEMLQNYSILTGTPLQQAAEQVMLQHDHLRKDATHSRVCRRKQAMNSLLRSLECDGYATIRDWGLPMAFIDDLAKEAFVNIDLRAKELTRTKKDWKSQNKPIVLSSGAQLKTLETSLGQTFWQNSTLLRTAVQYLGPGAELAGYETLHLSNELKSVSQYLSGRWHHDRCGARLKTFLFLHNVSSAGSRPTQVARGSHKTLYWSYHDLSQSRFSDSWVESNYEIASMGGPKGGGFILDTNALHRGVVQGDAPRTVLILEFNNARKDAALLRTQSTFRLKTKQGFPCPSRFLHVLKRSARDVLGAKFR